MSSIPKPVVLVILDGWGVAPPSPGNAIALAETPVYKRLITTYPTCTLQASGEAVGLPWGEMGNSEVGHLTIGAGKILYQDLLRINRSIIDQSIFSNEVLLACMDQAKSVGRTLHIMGLVSDGGVHSHIGHLFALLDMAKAQGVQQVMIHAFLDGRDTAFDSAKDFIKDLENKLKKLKLGQIASLSGRFYAMDRDNHWDRVQMAYDAIVRGQGRTYTSATEAISQSYAARMYDEQFEPAVVTGTNGQPVGVIKPGDSLIFFNFRSDRARQLTKAFTQDNFDKFPAENLGLNFVCMTEYDKTITAPVAFPAETVEEPLAKLISEQGYRQLHIAETEKYAHVTYFLNGGREQPYQGEDNVLIPSPSVATYDQKPEMSARGITDRFLQEIRYNIYDFVVINFANADMVGHTGNLPATIKAVEIIDECLGEIVAATLEFNGMIFITADHGNAEGLINLQTGQIDKEHSNTPVPFIMVGQELQNKALAGFMPAEDLSQLTPAGVLADVAPTILKVMNIQKDSGMTGQSLL